ncbi:hypothetical protein ES703_36081 [subsurface metagenome]
MKRLSLVATAVLVLALGGIGCAPQALPPTTPPTVDESYYSDGEVIAITKQQLPDVVQSYSILRDGKLVDKTKMTAIDLRVVGRWQAKYLGRGKWQVTCAINFVNWFDYEKPMHATGTFTWNFYEKSNTNELIGYGEITTGEFKL